MAVLTASELATMRRACAAVGFPINYTKAQINAALQAIEDAMITQNIPAGAVGATVSQYLSGRIDLATSPLVMTAAQKKALFAWWSSLKFERDK